MNAEIERLARAWHTAQQSAIESTINAEAPLSQLNLDHIGVRAILQAMIPPSEGQIAAMVAHLAEESRGSIEADLAAHYTVALQHILGER